MTTRVHPDERSVPDGFTMPHLYYFQGSWWCSRNGHTSFRRGVTLNDACCGSFREACVAALLSRRPYWL